MNIVVVYTFPLCDVILKVEFEKHDCEFIVGGDNN